MQTDVFPVVFKLLCKKKKKPIDKQLPDSYHITVLFSQFGFYLLKGTVMQLVDILDLLQEELCSYGKLTFVVNLLIWSLGSAQSRWTKPWGWLFSSSYCCQHAWPSHSTSRASLTLCWRMKGRPICLQRMIPSYLDLDQCAPSAASAIFAWCSALT